MAEPQGRAERRAAASSVAPIAPLSGLPASLHRDAHRTPATSTVSPNPPTSRRSGENSSSRRRGPATRRCRRRVPVARRCPPRAARSPRLPRGAALTDRHDRKLAAEAVLGRLARDAVREMAAAGDEAAVALLGLAHVEEPDPRRRRAAARAPRSSPARPARCRRLLATRRCRRSRPLQAPRSAQRLGSSAASMTSGRSGSTNAAFVREARARDGDVDGAGPVAGCELVPSRTSRTIASSALSTRRAAAARRGTGRGSARRSSSMFGGRGGCGPLRSR